ncbi:MAG TPA: hypothetical protein VGQ76_27855, partial [Thermoanaerobaculia bacterium]|nr:hypothetical protein [Thermoanaerobaculia bacterium]
MDLEFARTLYFREVDRRAHLDSAPTSRVAILGIVGGVFTYYSERLRFAGDPMTWFFIVCVAGAVFFSVLSIVWIIRSYFGYRWQYLPLPDELSAHFQSLMARHEEDRFESADPDELFERDLRHRLIQAATRNTLSNNQRSELLHRGSLFLS